MNIRPIRRSLFLLVVFAISFTLAACSSADRETETGSSSISIWVGSPKITGDGVTVTRSLSRSGDRVSHAMA